MRVNAAANGVSFDILVEETRSWVEGHDPWEVMDPASAQRLQDLVERVRKEPRERTHHRTRSFLKDLQDAALRQMIVAEPAVWERLPAVVRAHVDQQCLLASGAWHQMFGFGADIQGNAVWEHARDLLLLQLAYDDLLDWRFGDMGVYQFWVAPEAARAGDFSNIAGTFECS